MMTNMCKLFYENKKISKFYKTKMCVPPDQDPGSVTNRFNTVEIVQNALPRNPNTKQMPLRYLVISLSSPLITTLNTRCLQILPTTIGVFHHRTLTIIDLIFL